MNSFRPHYACFVQRSIHLKNFYGFLFLLFASLLLCISPSLAIAQHWIPIDSDLWYAETTLPVSLWSPQVLLVRTSATRYRLRVLRAQDMGEAVSRAKDIAKKFSAPVVINANFFDESQRALGLVMTRGNILNPIHRQGRVLTGMLVIESSQKIRIVPRDQFSPQGVLDAIQAGPRLLSNNSLVPGVQETSSTRRAGICLRENGEVLLYTVQGLLGISVNELQKFLLFQLSCSDALNLDGGGSTQLFIGKPTENRTLTSLQEVEGKDKVPIFLGLVPGEQSEAFRF